MLLVKAMKLTFASILPSKRPNGKRAARSVVHLFYSQFRVDRWQTSNTISSLRRSMGSCTVLRSQSHQLVYWMLAAGQGSGPLTLVPTYINRAFPRW